MKILDRYLGMSVASSTLVVMLVLLAVFFFIDFVEELDNIGKGNYSLLDALQYILLIQPRRIYELFPMAALLGTLTGLGWLAGNSELVVIRASGVSLVQIVLSVMKIGVIMMLLALFVGEVVAPASEHYAENNRSLALADRIALKTNYGFWTRDGQSFINIRTIHPDGRLNDIRIYEFDGQHRLRVASTARQAYFKDGAWILEGILQSTVRNDSVAVREVTRASWDSLLSPALINLVAVKPERLSTWDLRKYINYLTENGQDAKRYELAFWAKVVLPLVTGVMVFLAIPFVFGPLRAVGMGQRIVVGSLVGIAFHLFNQTFGQVGLVYNFNPLFSALAPVGLFFILSGLLIRRVH